MAALARLVLCGAIAGCGRYHFDAAADGGGDAPSDAPGCKGTGTWNPPVRIDELDTPTKIEYGGEISHDGLALYFDSDVTGDEEIYVATRASRSDPFQPATRIVELGSSGTDGDASVTDDGLELWFASDRLAAADFCVYAATRATVGDPWTGITRQDQLCVTAKASGPSISADGRTLLYNTVTGLFGEGQLMVTQRASRAAPFPDGTSLGISGLNGYGVLSRDQLTIYFETVVGGSVELGTATRATTADVFGNVQPISELDTLGSNVDASVTADDAEIVFASDRAGSFDLFHATRPCL